MEDEEEIKFQEHIDEESTAPTTASLDRYNKYELLEHVLSFVDSAEELNDVLSGYFK